MAQIKVQEKYHKKSCFHEMLEFYIRNIATLESFLDRPHTVSLKTKKIKVITFLKTSCPVNKAVLTCNKMSLCSIEWTTRAVNVCTVNYPLRSHLTSDCVRKQKQGQRETAD